MQIQTMTFEQLVGAAAVILLLVGIYNTVMGAVKTHRDEKKRREQPVSNLEQTVQEHEARLKRDHERLKTLEEASRIELRALMALLSHEISGNSDEKLIASFEEIKNYLIEK